MRNTFLKPMSKLLAVAASIGVFSRCASTNGSQQAGAAGGREQNVSNTSDNFESDNGNGDNRAPNSQTDNSAAINSAEETLASNDSKTLDATALIETALSPSNLSDAARDAEVPNGVASNGATHAPGEVNLYKDNGSTKALADFAAPSAIGDAAHGTLTWVGYNYRAVERILEIQIVTEGSPSYHMFQETNRKGQSELIVRFLNTELRKKVRRDVDATEFRSPVSYIRMRTDQNFHHTDVVMTLRDSVQPRVVTKGSSLMFVFSIPDHWFAPKANEVPVSSAEVIDADSPGFSGTAASSAASRRRAVYIGNPGADAFGSRSRDRGVPLVPKSESSRELVPQSKAQTLPHGEQLLQNSPTDFNEFTYSINSVAQAAIGENNGTSPLLEDESLVTEAAATNVALTPGEVVPEDPMAYGGISNKKVIRIEFHAAPVSQIVALIARESGVSFMISPQAGSIKASISLKDVPWDVALKAVLQANSLGMKEVAPGLIRIDLLASFIKSEADESIARQSAAALVPLKVLIMALSYAKASEAVPLVAAMLPKPSDQSNIAEARNYNRFKVQADVRSNSVIVEATPDILAAMKTLLERLDVATPQVRIATRLVELTEDINDGLGFTWGTPLNVDPGRGLGFGTLPFPNYMASTFSVDPGGASQQGGTAAFRFGSINNIVALDLKLRMYELQKKAETLQTQEISVQDLVKASISAGATDYILTAGGINTAGTVSPINYNLKLEVTPHITADGVVQMLIDIEGDSPSDAVAAAAPVASKNTRKIVTTLLKRSGETVVIGGLYTSDRQKTTRGIPILSSIPILGALFRSVDNKSNKKELLVMVTPTILENAISQSGSNSSGGSMPMAAPVGVPSASIAPKSEVVARADLQSQSAQQQAASQQGVQQQGVQQQGFQQQGFQQQGVQQQTASQQAAQQQGASQQAAQQQGASQQASPAAAVQQQY
jgi:type IV pilus secretin PilQ/predicted competence protein